jgi:hypothetical protein
MIFPLGSAMNKAWIIFIIAIACLVAVGLSGPIRMDVYALEILAEVGDNYELKLSPDVFIQQVSLGSKTRGYSVSEPLHTYSLFGINQVVIQINATGINENGTVFFDGRFVLDTLADRKIDLYRTYDAAYQSSQIMVRLDALLFIDFETTADINKEYHGTWNVTLP